MYPNFQRTLSTIYTALALIALLLSTSSWAAELDRIGRFDFPSSASPEAQQHFELGVGYLHSFGMAQAQTEFRRAQEIDPDFALAYWGEAFTYQHPFFGQKDDGPGEALQRLGATSAQRLAKAPTEREKGFLRAAEAYALTEGGMAERRTAWMHAMADLYAQFPDDNEVKAFYTVSMLSGATASGDDRNRINMQAGAMALELFKENEMHPGAAHYVIHAFDDPLHAPIALEAAQAYADIAPAVSHARHMPTHIFIQHGMWEEVSDWNDSAFLAGAALWQSGDSAGDQNHSSDWGQYGDLQRGDLARSQLWIERAQQVQALNPDQARSAGTVKTMQARHIIESQNWDLQSLSDDLSADQLLALGLSAANLGNLELANQVADKLAAMADSSPNNAAVRIMAMEVAGLTLMRESSAQGRTDALKRQQAVQTLNDAVNLANQQRPPRGAANPLKPPHELAAEELLDIGEYQAALDLFEQTLLRMPNRPLSLLGAARSYAKLGEEANAKAAYESFLALWNDDSLASVYEAKQYVN